LLAVAVYVVSYVLYVEFGVKGAERADLGVDLVIEGSLFRQTKQVGMVTLAMLFTTSFLPIRP
jgi:hypothetical protein